MKLIETHKSFPKAKECVDSFFFYNEHTFVTFLEICGFNRARQRDKIARLLDNFASLQDEVKYYWQLLHNCYSLKHFLSLIRLKELTRSCISSSMVIHRPVHVALALELGFFITAFGQCHYFSYQGSNWSYIVFTNICTFSGKRTNYKTYS